MDIEIKHITDTNNKVYKMKMDIEPNIDYNFILDGLEEKDVHNNEIEWTVMSKDKKRLVSKKLKKASEPFQYRMTEMECGNYSYYLTASYKMVNTHKLVTAKKGINLTGVCDPQILNLLANGLVVKPGIGVYFSMEMTGVNGNEIIVEVYNKKNKKRSTLYFHSIEGISKVFIPASTTIGWESEEEMYVKIKAKKIRKKDSEANKNKGYLALGDSSEYKILSLTIIKENPRLESEVPESKTVTAIDGNIESSQKEILEGKEFALKIRKTSEVNGESVRQKTKTKTKLETEEDQASKIEGGEEIDLTAGEKVDIDVCAEYEYIVYADDKEVNSGTVKWSLAVKEDNTEKEYTLQELKEMGIIRYPHSLSGNKVCFRVPFQLGQKEVTIIARFFGEDKKEIELKGNLKVVDHIVAAFYRLNTKEEHSFEIKGIVDVKNAWNAQSWIPIANWPLKIPPLYHIQGMYRYKNDLYFAGSVRAGTRSFLFKISGIEEEGNVSNAKHVKSFIFGKGALSYFDHPGGVQVANNIIALGFEKYDDLGVQTVGGSLVGFFDTEGGLDPQIARSKYEKTCLKDEDARKTDENMEFMKVRIVQDSKYIDKYDSEFDKVYDINGNLVSELWYRYREGTAAQVHKIDNNANQPLKLKD